MALSLFEYVRRTIDSGLLSEAELQEFVANLPAGQRPADGEGLARQLVKAKKLTTYQATAIYQGKGKGLCIGKYVILGTLGRGGVGVVYKALHRPMQRVVALKMLSSSAKTMPGAVARFQREVRAVSQLDHPNIVAAYDADEIDGRWFLVMKYVDGTDLTTLVEQRGPLPVPLAISCIVQAARGLEYAHSRGIFHRDIKPKNLLLDRDGTLLILDLGLARFDSSRALDGDPRITETGQLLGTIDYMPPEQAVDMRLSDARSDIYSLGYTLWYLLTGKPAYTGSQRIERLMAHWEQPIPSLRAACPDAPETLERVFVKMVAKNPSDRYQNASDVITDLERCRAAEAAVNIRVTRASEAQELDDFLAMLAGSKPDRRTRPDAEVDASSPISSPHLKTAKTGAGTTGRKIRASKSKEASRHPMHPVSIARRSWFHLLMGGIVVAVIVTAMLRERIPRHHQPPMRETQQTAGVPSPADSKQDFELPPPFFQGDFSELFNGHDLENWTEVGQKETWRVSEDAIRGASTAWLLYDDQKLLGGLIPGDFALRMEVLVPKDGAGEILIGARKDGQAADFLKVGILTNETDIDQGNNELAYALVTAGQWSTVTVRVTADHVTVWPGGQKTPLSKFQLSKPVLSGSIGLGSPKQSVAFRAIRLKELEAR
jgi:serine/threonine protein kinase